MFAKDKQFKKINIINKYLFRRKCLNIIYNLMLIFLIISAILPGVSSQGIFDFAVKYKIKIIYLADVFACLSILLFSITSIYIHLLRKIYWSLVIELSCCVGMIFCIYFSYIMDREFVLIINLSLLLILVMTRKYNIDRDRRIASEHNILNHTSQ